MWPRCGPGGPELGRRVPTVRSAEILRRWRRSGRCAPTVVGRERPPDGGATGTRRARPARTKLATGGSDGYKLNQR